MTQLLFIRHGETDWNRELRFQGQLDVPLNAAGRLQAQHLARRIAQEPVDAVISSDLQRARETAEACAQALGLPVALEAGLREQSFGVLEGLRAQEVRESHPEIWARWGRHEADYAAPGGESVRVFHQRVTAAVQALAERHRGRTLLVVAHGGVLDMLWRAAQSLPLHGPRRCAIPNCGINRLRWTGGQLAILGWADDAHLQGLPEQPSTVPASVQLAGT